MTDDAPSAPPPLRDLLIAAGMELLAEGGTQGLTLRRAAARAGVSHAAPAHHFDGLSGLLTAIATEAFRRFSDEMRKARAEAGHGARAELVGICEGYLVFAQRNSGLFHLMFLSDQVNRDDPGLTIAAGASYDILRDACAAFAPPHLRQGLEIAVWSMVHGYATLGLGTRQSRKRAFAEVPPFATLLDRLVPPEGWR